MIKSIASNEAEVIEMFVITIPARSIIELANKFGDLVRVIVIVIVITLVIVISIVLIIVAALVIAASILHAIVIIMIVGVHSCRTRANNNSENYNSEI